MKSKIIEDINRVVSFEKVSYSQMSESDQSLADHHRCSECKEVVSIPAVICMSCNQSVCFEEAKEFCSGCNKKLDKSHLLPKYNSKMI